MMSLNAFSQTATDSTKIQLTKPIARFVVKDLIKFDGLTKEMGTLKALLQETNSKLDTQTKLSANLEVQVQNYQSILLEKDNQLQTSSQLSKALEVEIKKIAFQKKLLKIGTISIGAVAVLSIIR